MNELNFTNELRCEGFSDCDCEDGCNAAQTDECGAACDTGCSNSCEEFCPPVSPEVAFDGCFYYSLVCGKAIILKSCSCLKAPQSTVTKIAVKREYRCITYDKTECCFWAVAKRCPHFIFKLNKCLQEIGHIEPCYPCCKSCEVIGISHNTCDDSLLLCTQKVLMRLCKGSTQPCVIAQCDSKKQDKCDCNCGCKPCCGCRHDGKAELITSIALVETALSHILNAEGEKLQKVIACTDDVETILCVNSQVNKTIISATHLEHVLYDKLSEVMNCDECFWEKC